MGVFERLLEVLRRTLDDLLFREVVLGWATARRHQLASTGDFIAPVESVVDAHGGDAAEKAGLESLWQSWLRDTKLPPLPRRR